ncbi:MAG TPA: hypothetical protein VM186_00195 [Planctomycetota bacterium]|nr:hypothetical protein [Planctomycetota bacterium]
MAEDREADNSDLNSILDEMGAGSAAAAAPSHSRASADSKLSHIENLLSEASTSAPSQTEAALSDGAPAPRNAAVPAEAKERKSPAPPSPKKAARERPQPAASPLPVPRKAMWFVIAFLTLNIVGILAVVAILLVFSRSQRQGAAELVSALHEVVQVQQQANPQEPPADKQAATDTEQAIKLFDDAQYEAALPLLQHSAAALPDRPDLLWKSGVAAMRVQQWRTALDAFQTYSESFPNDKLFYQALANLATCYKQLGFYAMARRTFFRLIALSGRLPDELRPLVQDAHLQVADCYTLEASRAEKPGSSLSAASDANSRVQGATDGQTQ